MLCSLRRFDKSEVAQQRMRIIKFYEKYGEKATYEAFGVSRKVISRWRKRLKSWWRSSFCLNPTFDQTSQAKTIKHIAEDY